MKLFLFLLNIIIYPCLLISFKKLLKYFRRRDTKNIALILTSYVVYVVLLIYLIGTDINLINNGKEPKFALPVSYLKDGGSTQYYGLGYGIFRINSISEELIDGKIVYGIDKGYKLRVMFIPIKSESSFVSNN